MCGSMMLCHVNVIIVVLVGLIGMHKTGCSGETRLVLHVSSSCHELVNVMFGSVKKLKHCCRCGCQMSPRPQAAQQGLSPCAGTTHPPLHPSQHHPQQLLCWLRMTHSQHPHQGGRQGPARGLSRVPLPGGTHPPPYMWINATKIRCVYVRLPAYQLQLETMPCLVPSSYGEMHSTCKACSKTHMQQAAAQRHLAQVM